MFNDRDSLLLLIILLIYDTRAFELIKETETHVIIGFFFGFFDDGGCGGNWSSCGCGDSESTGVSETFTDFVDGGERNVVGSEGATEDSLVGVDEGMRSRSDGGEFDFERNGRDAFDGVLKTLTEGFVSDVENCGFKDGTIVVDAQDGHTEVERHQTEHLHEDRLGGSDLLSVLDNADFRDNFNGSLDDLGGNSEGLEEGSLVGVHSSATSGDENVALGSEADLGGGLDPVGDNGIADLAQVSIGEDKTDVSTDQGKQSLEFRVLGNNFLHGLADHRVLTHQNDGKATESSTDLVHLRG